MEEITAKYPFDIISLVRPNKTMSIEARITPNQGEHPLQPYADFSRFKLNVINEKKAAWINMKFDSIPSLKKRTEHILEKYYEYKYGKMEMSNSNSPAYTVRFMAGTYRGKTPVEILLENPKNGKDILNKQYLFLKENLQKFPKNKELIDAIADASKQDLTDVAVKSAPSPFPLLEIGARPQMNKKREDGKVLCCECKVTFSCSDNFPVAIKILNYYAPVKKREDGRLNVSVSEKDTKTEISNEFKLSEEEWLFALSEMERVLNNFCQMYTSIAFKRALDADKKNRNASLSR